MAFHNEYAQVIGTSGTVESFTPAVHDYFHALVTVGECVVIHCTSKLKIIMWNIGMA